MPDMLGIWNCFVGGLNFQHWSSCEEYSVLNMKPCKTLLINKPYIYKRNKKKKKGEFTRGQLAQIRCQNLFVSKIDPL
jgi:hypothetical protein